MTEWINIIGGAIGLIGGLCGIGGLVVAYKQLRKIAENQNIAMQNQKMDILKVVLEIESQISQRSVEMSRASVDYLTDTNDKNKEAYFLAMKENYFNALDRLCFCIRKGYIPEKEWEREYRNMIQNTIAKEEFKDDFNPNTSPYKNIIKLNDRLQDSVIE